MIYTDGTHLISDSSLDELHAFARRLKLKPAWFQDHPKHPHYDFTTPQAFSRALHAGARVVTSRELVGLCREVTS